MHFDDRIKRAAAQNSGHLSACSNCHLKLGHTKKYVNLVHEISIFMWPFVKTQQGENVKDRIAERNYMHSK